MSAAGDAKYYTFVLKDEETGEYYEDVEIHLDRVTSVIGVLNKPFLVTWAHNFTRDAISGMVDMLALRPDVTAYDIIDMLADADMLAEYLKENKLRPEDYTAERSEEGTEAHAFLESLATVAAVNRGRALNMALKASKDEGRSGHIQAVAKWWVANDPQVVASEVKLISLRLGVMGTCDLIWRDANDVLWCTDLKTRKADGQVYESDRIQTGAYEIIWNETHPKNRIDKRSVLLAKADGKYKDVEADNDPTMFLHLLAAYRKGAK